MGFPGSWPSELDNDTQKEQTDHLSVTLDRQQVSDTAPWCLGLFDILRINHARIDQAYVLRHAFRSLPEKMRHEGYKAMFFQALQSFESQLELSNPEGWNKLSRELDAYDAEGWFEDF